MNDYDMVKIRRLHEKICPRIKCVDCIIKDDINLYSKKGYQRHCRFYLEYINGYAGGYLMEDGKLKRKMIMDCPREFKFCSECEKVDCEHRQNKKEVK